MPRSRLVLAAITSLGIIAAMPGASRAGVLTAGANCTGGSKIGFSWTFFEDAQNPTGHPEWVGYDVLRRSVSPCDAFVRVNAQPYARTPGATQTLSYTEVPSVSGMTYEYDVVLVDANRQQIFLDPIACDCSAHQGWASCPEFSAPLTQGTLEDWGWALFVQPCAGTCYGSFYFEGPLVDVLRPYVGTGTPLRFFGSASCGTVEGCRINVAAYEFLSTCSPTPAARSSWGRIKTIYR